MKIIYQTFNKALLTMCCILGTSCGGNPYHSVPVTGSINVTVDSNKNICFTPNFDHLMLGTKKYTDLQGIKIQYVHIYQSTGDMVWGSDYKDEFEVITDRDTVCINKTNFIDEKTPYRQLVDGAEYGISVWGTTSDRNHHIDLSQKFTYGY